LRIVLSPNSLVDPEGTFYNLYLSIFSVQLKLRISAIDEGNAAFLHPRAPNAHENRLAVRRQAVIKRRD
jgi:hypothetical protein